MRIDTTSGLVWSILLTRSWTIHGMTHYHPNSHATSPKTRMTDVAGSNAVPPLQNGPSSSSSNNSPPPQAKQESQVPPTTTSATPPQQNPPSQQQQQQPPQQQQQPSPPQHDSSSKSSSNHKNGPPLPLLPWGDSNVLVLTDVHGWVGGHGEKQESLDADYGHILSFYEMTQRRSGHDLWFVMNGDWTDGTGLSMNDDVSYLVPIVEKMPYHLVNVGDAELRKEAVVDYILRPGGFVDWWGDRLLSSNTYLVPSTDSAANATSVPRPLGNQYRILQGTHTTVLAFGFCIYFTDHAPQVMIRPIDVEIKQDWFRDALLDNKYDSILLLAHMDHHATEIGNIVAQIRSFMGEDMPVQVLAGHSHRRGFSRPEDTSATLQAGRYLDTIGFVSFPTERRVRKGRGKPQKHSARIANYTANHNVSQPNNNGRHNRNHDFKHVFIDPGYHDLRGILRMDHDFGTPRGVALSEFVTTTQEKLGLRHVVGCVRHSHFLNRHIHHRFALWGMFRHHVVPHVFAEHNDRAVLMLEKDTWRYDLLAEELTMDEILQMAPTNETLYIWKHIPGPHLLHLNQTLNDPNRTELLTASGSLGLLRGMDMLPNFVMAPAQQHMDDAEEPDTHYDLITSERTVSILQKALEEIRVHLHDPVALSMTTTDLWLQFLDETNLCQTKTKGTIKPKKTPGQGGNHGHHHHHSDHGVKTIAAVTATTIEVFVVLMCFLMFGALAWRRMEEREARRQRRRRRQAIPTTDPDQDETEDTDGNSNEWVNLALETHGIEQNQVQDDVENDNGAPTQLNDVGLPTARYMD